MQSLHVTLKTLTPLWTGGAETKMDRMHETGIIGSLRWWYEAIVRGLGGDVCNPTSENPQERCPRDEKQQKQGKEEYCNVCRVFGATGQGRAFRLSIALHEQTRALWKESVNIRPYRRQRGWYLPPGWIGEGTFTFTGRPEALSHIATLLLFLEQWGGIGAKQPLGYGRFAIENRSDIEKVATAIHVEQQDQQTPDLPGIQDFLFYQVVFQPLDNNWWKLIDGIRQMRAEKQGLAEQVRIVQGMIPVSPVIKNALRFGQTWPSRTAEEWLFGTVHGDYRQQSKISIGWAIQQESDSWYIPGWVWLPRERRVAREYPDIKRQIQHLIQEQTTWLQALDLRDNVKRIQVMMKPGHDIWKEFVS